MGSGKETELLRCNFSNQMDKKMNYGANAQGPIGISRLTLENLMVHFNFRPTSRWVMQRAQIVRKCGTKRFSIKISAALPVL